MGLEDYNIVGTYLRGYLAGLRRMANTKYPDLLKAAGLERYAERYPPNTFEPAATGQEISGLIEAVRTTFNPYLFNLYMRNLGREFALIYATNPVLQESFAQSRLQPEATRLYELVRVILNLNCQFLDEEIELEEPTRPDIVTLIYKNCLYCAGITRTDKPACPMTNAFYRALLGELTGDSYHVQETSCGAVTGSHNCHFLIQRT